MQTRLCVGLNVETGITYISDSTCEEGNILIQEFLITKQEYTDNNYAAIFDSKGLAFNWQNYGPVNNIVIRKYFS